MGRRSLGLTPEEMKAHRAELERYRRHKRLESEARLAKEVVAHRLAQACMSVVIKARNNDNLWEDVYNATLEEMLSHPEWEIKVNQKEEKSMSEYKEIAEKFCEKLGYNLIYANEYEVGVEKPDTHSMFKLNWKEVSEKLDEQKRL